MVVCLQPFFKYLRQLEIVISRFSHSIWHDYFNKQYFFTNLCSFFIALYV